nr:unnamed protein product [Callosobruchus analis]
MIWDQLVYCLYFLKS